MLPKIIKLMLLKDTPVIKDNSIASQLYRTVILLVAMLVLHTVAMMLLEELSLGDSVWLTLTTATTVGYGDLSAQTAAGRVATVIILYIGGISLLAQTAAMYFEYRQEIRTNMLKGDWSWNMNNHIVFFNCPNEVGEDYFYSAILGLRRSNSSLAKYPIIIVSEKFKNGISDRLRKLDVVHISKPLHEQETLISASINNAHTIVILSQDNFDNQSDSINFELVYRLREMGATGRIIAEIINDENRNRIKKIGANSVLRPIRAYPEMLIRAVIAPNSEQIIETLFDSRGEECIRCDVNLNTQWSNIIKKLVEHDIGIPIAYEDQNHKIINNPSVKNIVSTSAVFIIVNETKAKTIQTNNNQELIKILKS